MVTLTLPSQLQSLAGGRKRLEIEAHDLDQLFLALDREAPLVRSQLFEPGGVLRQFVGLFVDDQQVLALGPAAPALRPGAQVVVVMAVAGG